STTGTINEAPLASIVGSNTEVGLPSGVTLDPSNNIYVSNGTGVVIFPPLGGSTGTLNEKPTATISGSNTGLTMPDGIALDSSNNIYVADKTSSMFIFPAVGRSTETLNEAPS